MRVAERGTAGALLAIASAADPDARRGRLRAAHATSDEAALLAQAADLADQADVEWLTLDLAGLVLAPSLGDGPPVVAALRHLRDRHPRSTEVQLALARNLDAGDPRARMEAWRSRYAAVTIDPTLDEAWVALGELQLAQGRGEEAEALWRAGVHHEPRSDLPYLRLARHLAATDRPDEALALLDERLTWHESTERLDAAVTRKARPRALADRAGPRPAPRRGAGARLVPPSGERARRRAARRRGGHDGRRGATAHAERPLGLEHGRSTRLPCCAGRAEADPPALAATRMPAERYAVGEIVGDHPRAWSPTPTTSTSSGRS